METLNYRRKPPEPPDRPERLTRAEWIIILSGAAVLATILVGAFFYLLSFPADF